MKVLLVATNRERAPYPVAPLGALCVAAAARTSADGSAASICASTGESGASAPMPSTRCAGSACS